MWWVRKPGVSFYDKKNDDEEGVSVYVTVLSLDMTTYYSLFLEILWIGLGVEIVVSIFLFREDFLVELILDHCACMGTLNLASEIRIYLVTWFTDNLGQNWRKPF